MVTKKAIDDDGILFLLKLLIALIEQKTQISIISAIDENSTNQQIPGAKAVYDLLVTALSGFTKLSKEVVSTLPVTGKSNVIYLVQKDPVVNKYDQWLDIDGAGNWFDLGDTDIDLSDYWSKNELEFLTNSEIQDMFDAALGS